MKAQNNSHGQPTTWVEWIVISNSESAISESAHSLTLRLQGVNHSSVWLPLLNRIVVGGGRVSRALMTTSDGDLAYFDLTLHLTGDRDRLKTLSEFFALRPICRRQESLQPSIRRREADCKGPLLYVEGPGGHLTRLTNIFGLLRDRSTPVPASEPGLVCIAADRGVVTSFKLTDDVDGSSLPASHLAIQAISEEEGASLKASLATDNPFGFKAPRSKGPRRNRS